jgi:hypothetical protein
MIRIDFAFKITLEDYRVVNKNKKKGEDGDSDIGHSRGRWVRVSLPL